MHLVDESCAEVLPDRRDSAAKPDVFTIGGFEGAFQRRVNTIGDEMEGGAAVHRDRCARVVGKHEDGCVVRWIAAPPPFPSVVWPRSSNWPEHVAAQDPRSDVDETACCEIIIDTCRAALISKHLPKRACGEAPFVQRHAADGERVADVLV